MQNSAQISAYMNARRSDISSFGISRNLHRRESPQHASKLPFAASVALSDTPNRHLNWLYKQSDQIPFAPDMPPGPLDKAKCEVPPWPDFARTGRGDQFVQTSHRRYRLPPHTFLNYHLIPCQRLLSA